MIRIFAHRIAVCRDEDKTGVRMWIEDGRNEMNTPLSMEEAKALGEALLEVHAGASEPDPEPETPKTKKK